MADEKSPEEGVDEASKAGGTDAEADNEGHEEKGAEEKGAEEEGSEEEGSEKEGPQEEIADEDASEAESEEEPPTVESLSAELAEAETRVAEFKDQALRAKADVENMRRRAARDVENAHKYALERMTGELLPVLDSLEKAVESAAATKDAGAIGEGVELSLKMFLTVLRKVGIEQLDPLGEPFDPQFHEALAMVENPDSEPNSVMEVIQRGYSLNGRLVRAAKVVVVKAAGGDEETDANTDA
ncbi:MAG: nucleotide exchange factor GrpE [Gammaproteobacteria bacterium]|nr:nucleotide exchange factor GrpE [Gammaproteobacteria bacterium]